MFAVPNAKRVKRSHLFQDDGISQESRSTRSASPTEVENDAYDDAEVSYGFEYDFVTPKSGDLKLDTPARASRPLADVEEAEQPEYQFHLFAPAPKSNAVPVQQTRPVADVRVRLSATPEPAELTESLSLDRAHFVRPNRPDLYYFTSALPKGTIEALRSQYDNAAVSTSDVLLRANTTKWPGTALPWRLIQVKLLNKTPNSKIQNHSESTQQKARATSRPSKKRRILFRRRLALRNELAAQSKVAEETEREKRTRRNREKKVKKKEREKRKKLDADGVDDGNGAENEIQPGQGPTEGEVQIKGLIAAPTEAEPEVVITPSSVFRTYTNDTDTQRYPASSSTRRASTAIAAPSVATVQRNPGMPPTRQAPTSRAPTAATTVAPVPKSKARAPTSAHPTRPRS